ncbi:MAG: histidine kinase [Lachnospiraceae bacterium]|jgi:two-component system sensor histidine kinase YesM|nr:histidine kinase [Lachnospiraceae bacterium]
MLKKFFLRRVRSFFMIMIIPNLLLFAVIGAFLLVSQQKAMEERGPVTLDIIEESLEASLFSTGYQVDVLMSNPSYSLSLKRLLADTDMDQKDLLFFSVLKNFFASYKSSYLYIHSIYLCLDGMDQFLTSTGQLSSIHTYYDMEWIEEYQSMDQGEKVLTSRRWLQRYKYDEPVEVLTIYYRATYLDGVIVINVDKEKYGKMLRNLLRSQKQQVMLLNRQGELLYATDSSFMEMGESELKDIFYPEIDLYLESGNFERINQTWKKLGDQQYFLYMQHSDFFDMYQVSAIPVSDLISSLRFYAWIAGLVLVLNIMLVLWLAFLYTKRSFYYIEECVNVFSAAERGEEIRQVQVKEQDEYGMILNNIIYLYLKNSQMRVELMEKQHLNEITEMMALQLQINPHFIFNTLQTMDFEIIRNSGIDSTPHYMIQQLSRVVKYALSYPMETVSLKEEIDYLKAYLEIQEFRFHNKGITYFEIDDTVLPCMVFRLLFQPMVENSFAHGVRAENEHIIIKIKAFDRGDWISIAVIDNGRGMDKKEVEELYAKINNKKSRNIGLTNLNRRLILHYGEQSRLAIQSRKGQGTIICFRIPRVLPSAETEQV